MTPSVNLHCGHYGRQPGTPLALLLARQVPSCLGIQFLLDVTFMKYLFTSSTAQGGGGSFKNRKPIGELGCCE